MNEIKTDLTTNSLNPKEIDTGIDRAPASTSSAVYTWIFAILANIGTYLYLVNNILNAGYHDLSLFIDASIVHEVMPISLLVSFIPTYLSGKDIIFKKVIGYRLYHSYNHDCSRYSLSFY